MPPNQKYADSILVTPPAELFAAGARFENEYRELEWRKFLPVDSSLPLWVNGWQVTNVNGLAPAPQPMNPNAPNILPQASEERSATNFNLYRFISGFGYQDFELIQANLVNMPLDQIRGNAVSRACEEFFETLAASGGTAAMATGLINQATGGTDVTLVTELPKAAGVGNAGWFDLSSGLPTATALEMALDLVAMCDRIESVTLNRNRATDVIMADALWAVFNRTVQGLESTRTARQIFAELRPGVNVSRWYKLDGAGASGRHRIVAYDARDPQGPRMVTPQEPTRLAPHRMLLAWQIPVVFTTGGVVIYKKQTMAYMDPVNQA
jgi:hypothetical protein